MKLTAKARSRVIDVRDDLGVGQLQLTATDNVERRALSRLYQFLTGKREDDHLHAFFGDVVAEVEKQRCDRCIRR